VSTFRLPRPPSVNNLFLTKGRLRIPTPAYKAWRAEAYKMIMVQRVGQVRTPIAGPYRAELVVQRSRGDLDNFYKAVSDALVHMGVIVDDSFADEIHLYWGDVEGCMVTVEPMETTIPTQ
jgi:Holliday junction resolvase RusA-like endonuclease